MNPFWCEYPRDFVAVRGADALTYLQSQISQDIRGLAVGASAYSFVLQPTGKIEALLRVNRVGEEEFILDVDPGYGAAVIARLNRFKIRVSVDIGAAIWRCIAVRDVAVLPDNPVPAWGLTTGYDLIGADPRPPVGIAAGTDEQLHAARIDAGWPAMGTEITDASIPAETGVTDLAVNFTKGCYPGQELVERMDSRGSAAPRSVRVVRGTGTVHTGDELHHDGKVVGRITSLSALPERWSALAMVARAVEPGDTLSINAAEILVEPAHTRT